METITIRNRDLMPKNFDITSSSFEKKGDELIIHCSKEEPVNAGEEIFIERDVNDKMLNIQTSLKKTLVVKSVSSDRKTITVDYPYRNNFIVKSVEFPKEGSNEFKITTDRALDLFQFDIWEIDGLSEEDIAEIKDVTPSNEFGLFASFGDKTLGPINGIYVYDKFLIESLKYGIVYFDEGFDPSVFYCSNFDTDIIAGTICRFSGSDFFYEADRDGKKVCLPFSGVKISRIEDYFTFKVQLKNKESIGLNQEDLVTSYFVEKIKDSCIPDIIDMERLCFEPFVKDNGRLRPVKNIIINPFFRKRDLPGWSTNDTKDWNIEFTDDTKMPAEEAGDKMSELGFTLGDVAFQKNVLKQSFLRLSFFDYPKVLDQQLLYFSTVFTNTSKIYGTYIKEINKALENRPKFYDEESIEANILDKIRLSFNITDRYDLNTSSEGFYTYLFPSLIDDLKETYGSSTIYMKVEFNHAGCGKTIPLVWRRNEFPVKDYTKKNEIGEIEVDINQYYKDLYIPLEIGYSEEYKKFVFIFPEEMLIKDTNTIVLNVFEPKINPNGENK